MSLLTPVDFSSLLGLAYIVVGVSLLAFFIRRRLGPEIWSADEQQHRCTAEFNFRQNTREKMGLNNVSRHSRVSRHLFMTNPSERGVAHHPRPCAILH